METSGCKRIIKILSHDSEYKNAEKTPWNKASSGELRYLKFENLQKLIAVKKL